MWLIDHILNRFNNKQEKIVSKSIEDIKEGKIPRHIAIIMDGNGRWAKSKGLPRTAGHQQGVKSLKEIIKVAKVLGVEYITVYAFSTENWRRPRKEVDFLMDLFQNVFLEELNNFDKEGIKVNIIGYKNRLPKNVKMEVEEVMDRTKENKEMVVNIALDYGARAELTEVLKEIASLVTSQELKVEEITEGLISKKLYTANQPDPDLLIRPGGEKRISNFLLWQLAYTEIYFCQTFWPDYGKAEFIDAIIEYQKRDRRFGGLNKK